MDLDIYFLAKIRSFLWRILKNSLPTAENLKRRNITPNAGFLRCGPDYR